MRGGGDGGGGHVWGGQRWRRRWLPAAAVAVATVAVLALRAAAGDGKHWPGDGREHHRRQPRRRCQRELQPRHTVRGGTYK